MLMYLLVHFNVLVSIVLKNKSNQTFFFSFFFAVAIKRLQVPQLSVVGYITINFQESTEGCTILWVELDENGFSRRQCFVSPNLILQMISPSHNDFVLP